MKKSDAYTQCLLRNGTKKQVAWIPMQFARANKVLRIKNEEGWKVIETYATFPAVLIHKYADDFKYHRQVTDV